MINTLFPRNFVVSNYALFPPNFSERKSSLCQFFHFLDVRPDQTRGGSEKVWTSKYSGPWAIVAKIADLGPPGAPQ